MNEIAQEIARHIREIHFGNNWTDSAMQEVLKDVTWQQAIAMPIPNANSIAVLVFHTNFYLNYVHKSIKEGVYKFDHNDSFKVTPIHSEADWQALLQKSWDDAEAFAQTVEKLSDNLNLFKVVPPYQNSFYKNLQGVVEHNHYHLGQIVLLKKMV
jgi:DinB superfamily